MHYILGAMARVKHVKREYKRGKPRALWSDISRCGSAKSNHSSSEGQMEKPVNSNASRVVSKSRQQWSPQQMAAALEDLTAAIGDLKGRTRQEALGKLASKRFLQ